MSAIKQVNKPSNEPILGYAPGSAEREKLQSAYKDVTSECVEIPIIIGGQRFKTDDIGSVTMPHDHQHEIAKFHKAGKAEVKQAIIAACAAKREWCSMPWDARAGVFLKAAELLAGPWRMKLNAATMAGQSKTCHQAEIDSACELIDFFRFNAKFAADLYKQQPASTAGAWNATDLRPLDGFVLAITPFNFTAIAGNLPAAPALMGNTVLWKPSEPQTLAAYYTYLILEEAGLPPGVINFLPGSGRLVAQEALADRDFAGLHFTGSTHVFRSLWKEIGNNIDNYVSYPRIVGETGGKDFVFAHPDCNEQALVTALVRGAFEYQGQKCSAASRCYIPQSVWSRISSQLLDTTSSLTIGDVGDFSNYLGAVINESSADRLQKAISLGADSANRDILVGGKVDKSKGWFVKPTIVQCLNPNDELMATEYFGPLLSTYVYPDHEWSHMLEVVDATSPYALTGAIFARDRLVIEEMSTALRFSAGNFYINDKPTGAVVGQQPFGGSRASGTNDKAGAPGNLMRWASPRTIKETFVSPTNYSYPFLG